MPISYLLSCSVSQNTIVLTDKQYRGLKRAGKCVAAYQAIESKHMMVRRNFATLMQSINDAPPAEPHCSRCYEASLRAPSVSGALNNYILVVKLFTSHLVRHVQLCIPRERQNISLIKQTLNDTYKHCFSFRLIDSLHDYLTVRGSIEHCMTLLPRKNMAEPESVDEPGPVKAILQKKMINGAQEFRQSVYAELCEQHDFVSLANDCNQNLDNIKQTALSLIYPSASQAVKTISKANTSFTSTFGARVADIYLTKIDNLRSYKVIDRQMLPPPTLAKPPDGNVVKLRQGA